MTISLRKYRNGMKDLDFKKLPSDLDAFSEEVYEFCPDSVDQGVGEVENLKELIKEMNGIWLWWD